MKLIYGVHPFPRPGRIASSRRNIDAIKNCNWQKRQRFFLVRLRVTAFGFCVSIWGFYFLFFCVFGRYLVFLEGGVERKQQENPLNWKKGEFLSHYVFVKPKDQSIKGCTKPQRRQTDGDFSISRARQEGRGKSWVYLEGTKIPLCGHVKFKILLNLSPLISTS